jgi:hypothetical protein
MFRNHVRSLHAGLVTLALLATHSQVARAQQAPKPAAEVQRWTALAGKFDGEATLTIAGKTTRFVLHHENRVIADGFGLLAHEEADVPGMGRYVAENLVGWDTGRKQLHLLTVSNDPYTHDHAGTYRDASHLTLRYDGMSDGKKLVEILPIEIVSANEYKFRSTLTIAGEGPVVFTADMKRTGETSSR